MAETIRVGIIGAGWPGMAHAKGYAAAGGFKIAAVADLIPARRKQFIAEFSAAKEYASAEALLLDKEIAAVSICLPNDLHVPVATAALKAGKHVLCESPPATDLKGARRIEAFAAREGKVLLYALNRRYGPSEQASRQAIAKGFVGKPYHVRASWTRTRAIPVGTGWYTDAARSGGGALIDLGVHMLDLGWSLLGQPVPTSVFAQTHRRFLKEAAATESGVEDAAFVLMAFEGGRSLELAVSWAANQPPAQNGAICRVQGESGALEVYTPTGPMLYRDFNAKGEAKATALKPPKTVHHPAMMRHFKQCIAGQAQPDVGAPEGVKVMAMIEAAYKSAQMGKSVDVKIASKPMQNVTVQ